jgi:hypothetical protein
VCVAFDRSSSYRPSKYTGLVLRGPGRLELRGRSAQVAVMTRQVTWWTGFDVRTVTTAPADLVPPQPRRRERAG